MGRFGEFLTVLRAGGQACEMSSELPLPKKKLPIAKLALAAVALVVVAALVVQVLGWQRVWDLARDLVAWGVAVVTGAGPVVYFCAMALLPAAGVPMAPFAMGAGPLFGAELGFTTIILLGIVAITFNLTVTYWLSRRWLRPFFTRLLARFGHKLPEVEGGDATDLIVLLRVTPGIPFFVQNYLLGLANAPFLRYLAISCGIQWTLNTAFMLFGDALAKGRGKLVLSAVLLLVAVIVGTHFVRKRMARKNAVP